MRAESRETTHFPAIDSAVAGSGLARASARVSRPGYRYAGHRERQPNWPRYFLLAHAAELAIRALLVSAKTGASGRAVGPEPGKHDLSALYEYACKHGLKSNPQVLNELSYLSEIHKNYVARYPKSPGQIWLASGFDDAVDNLLRDTWEHIRVA